jgi:Fe-S-cluster-containing hydrogenase component 2
MKACPTKAIRVRNNKARIEGLCIDCGECIRICPRDAILGVTTGMELANLSRFTILSASPVLYAQFGPDATPNRILLALRKVFRFVYDQAYTHELYSAAAELYIQKCREEKRAVWPMISPVCPVVNRLIAYRFPSLLENILPIVTPRELAARELRKRLYCNRVFKLEDFGLYHVSPCSAKMIDVKEPMFLEKSFIDGILGISEVYHSVFTNLSEVEENIILHQSSGVGIAWGVSGGEIAGFGPGNYLAVSGVQETIRYLEKMEMGLLRDIEFIEFRSCSEGCIGGHLTVADKYQAKRTVERLVRRYGIEKRVDSATIRKAFEEGWFFTARKRVPLSDHLNRLSISDAIERQDQIEKMLHILPQKECGACGSPDCRTFAEDVFDGKASMKDCFYLRMRDKGEGN